MVRGSKEGRQISMVQTDTVIRELIERAINAASVMLPDKNVLMIRIMNSNTVMVNNHVFTNIKSSNRTKEKYGVYLYFNENYIVYLDEDEKECKKASFKLINKMISAFVNEFNISSYPIDISVGYEDLMDGVISDGNNSANICELHMPSETNQFKLEDLKVYETGWKVRVWKEQ